MLMLASCISNELDKQLSEDPSDDTFRGWLAGALCSKKSLSVTTTAPLRAAGLVSVPISQKAITSCLSSVNKCVVFIFNLGHLRLVSALNVGNITEALRVIYGCWFYLFDMMLSLISIFYDHLNGCLSIPACEVWRVVGR
jgi:hypothetical protein